jgi:hypothetical protein
MEPNKDGVQARFQAFWDEDAHLDLVVADLLVMRAVDVEGLVALWAGDEARIFHCDVYTTRCWRRNIDSDVQSA